MARMDHNLIEAVNNEIKYPPPFSVFYVSSSPASTYDFL
jgi:hypothetical protein